MLEAGNSRFNSIRDLLHRSKDKLVRSYRMLRNVVHVVHVDSLSEHKVPMSLSLIRTELIMALEKDYGEVAKGTWKLLCMLNGYAVHPSFTVNTHKIT